MWAQCQIFTSWSCWSSSFSTDESNWILVYFLLPTDTTLFIGFSLSFNSVMCFTSVSFHSCFHSYMFDGIYLLHSIHCSLLYSPLTTIVLRGGFICVPVSITKQSHREHFKYCWYMSFTVARKHIKIQESKRILLFTFSSIVESSDRLWIVFHFIWLFRESLLKHQLLQPLSPLPTPPPLHHHNQHYYYHHYRSSLPLLMFVCLLFFLLLKLVRWFSFDGRLLLTLDTLLQPFLFWLVCLMFWSKMLQKQITLGGQMKYGMEFLGLVRNDVGATVCRLDNRRHYVLISINVEINTKQM